jgi:hypothetical protein
MISLSEIKEEKSGRTSSVMKDKGKRSDLI